VDILGELLGLSEALIALVIDMAPSILLALVIGGLIESMTRKYSGVFQLLVQRRWLAHPAALLMAFASPL